MKYLEVFLFLHPGFSIFATNICIEKYDFIINYDCLLNKRQRVALYFEM